LRKLNDERDRGQLDDIISIAARGRGIRSQQRDVDIRQEAFDVRRARELDDLNRSRENRSSPLFG